MFCPGQESVTNNPYSMLDQITFLTIQLHFRKLEAKTDSNLTFFLYIQIFIKPKVEAEKKVSVFPDRIFADFQAKKTCSTNVLPILKLFFSFLLQEYLLKPTLSQFKKVSVKKTMQIYFICLSIFR